MNYRVVFGQEPCDVFVGRPSRWGNPFPIGLCGTRHEVLDLFEQYVYSRPEYIHTIRQELKGKILGCACPKEMPCHGDFLSRIANDCQMAYELKG